ncbi:MAG: hypothetical protein PVG26_09250 [Desulfobacterales bacterium]|jgi:hypothetical protein
MRLLRRKPSINAKKINYWTISIIEALVYGYGTRKEIRQGGVLDTTSIGRCAFDRFQAVNRLRLHGGIGKGFTG